MADEARPIDVSESLRDVMRSYPQGVTVVTARVNEKLWGMTASSFISASLNPPLVLVSIMKNSVTYDAFMKAKNFAVNMLADDQKSVSDRFAGRVVMRDRFEGLKYYFDLTDSPIIYGVVGYIECEKWKDVDAGDHTVLIGRVLNAKKLARKVPLVYFSQQYTTIVPPEYSTPAVDIMW
jgi:flavin reductase (DIM6/NTAB) family NADH-FMN oxidoreductase RutF